MEEASKILKLIYISILLTNASAVLVTIQGGTGMRRLEVMLGEEAELSCSANPTIPSSGLNPTLSWTFSKDPKVRGKYLYVSGEVFPGTDPRITYAAPYSLRILRTIKSDSGYYTCSVAMPDDIPSFGSATYALAVLHAPDKPLCVFPRGKNMTIGSVAEFHCQGAPGGAPKPYYAWYKDGEELPYESSNWEKFEKSKFSYDNWNGTLTFSSVTKYDTGYYHCTANNRMGSAECASSKIEAVESGGVSSYRAVIGPLVSALVLHRFVFSLLCR